MNKYMFLFAFLISCQQNKLDKWDVFKKEYTEQSVYHDCDSGSCSEMITPHVHSQYLKWEDAKDYCENQGFDLLDLSCEYSKSEAYCFVNIGINDEIHKSFTYYCDEYNCNIIDEYEACNIK